MSLLTPHDFPSRRPAGTSLVPITTVIILGICVLILINAFTPPTQIQATAESNARTHLDSMNQQGAKVTCSDTDSDGDAYVTCTVFDPARTTPFAIECRYRQNVQLLPATGCKLASVPLTP